MSESSDYSLNEAPALYAGADKLEFPDWSGHLPHRSRVPNDEWLAYCLSNLPQIRSRPGYSESRKQDGITAEFRF